MTTDNSCIFCRIIQSKVPAKMAYRDDQCIAIWDVNPQAPTHLLILPNQHLASVAEMTAADETLMGHLLRVASDLAQAEGVGATGYRLVINTGPQAGQSVFHLHIHLLGGRTLGWPPG